MKGPESSRKQQGNATAVSQRVSRKKKSSNSITTNSTVNIPATNVGLVDNSDVSDVAVEEVQTEVVKNVMGNEDIDPNVCCMRFQLWHDDVLEGGGAEWVSCKCGRWMHEDCIEDVVTDNAGFQRFCSFCIDKYTL